MRHAMIVNRSSLNLNQRSSIVKKSVARNIDLIFKVAVITCCFACKLEASTTCLQRGCIDESDDSSSQLIQLSNKPEPLATSDVEQSASIEANRSHDIHKTTGNERSKNWLWKYIDEQGPIFEVLNRENSLDERLANLIYVAEIARYIKIDFHTINTGNQRLDRVYESSIVGKKVEDIRCGIELNKMVSLHKELEGLVENKRKFGPLNGSFLLEAKHIRLARVLDSYGRYESGMIAGKSHFLGAYEQCVETQLELGNNKPNSRTGTRYCIAKLDISMHLTSTLRMLNEDLPETARSLNVGMCLPESCHTKSFVKYRALFEELLHSQFQLPKTMFHNEKPELKSVHCLPDEDSPFRQIPLSGWLLIGTLVIWFSLIVFITYINQQRRQRQMSTEARSDLVRYLFASLCLKKSWQDFTLETIKPHRDNRIQLDSLNPIKVLGCAYIVWGHSALAHLSANMNSLKAYKQIDLDPFMKLNVGGTVVIDCFYVISGIYLALKSLRYIQSRGQKPSETSVSGELKVHAIYSVSIIISRWARLLPLYFLVFWFKKSLAPLLGSGPAWDYGLNKVTWDGSCRLESWATPFIFLAAYTPMNRQCLPSSWSVAGDMYFAVFLSPVIVLMVRRPKLAALISVIICLSSTLSMFNALWSVDHDLDKEISELRTFALFHIFDKSNTIYTAPQYRVSSILIGCLAGLLLNNYSRNNIKDWPAWYKGIATKLSLSFMVVLLSGPILLQELDKSFSGTHSSHQGTFVHANTTFRLLWCVSSAIIFTRMVTDWKDNSLLQTCAGHFWKIAAMLNYAIVLIHPDVLGFQHHLATSTMLNYSKFDIFSLFASTYFISCALGLVIFVCIENPIDKLIRCYLDSSTIDQKRKSLQVQREQNDIRTENLLMTKSR